MTATTVGGSQHQQQPAPFIPPKFPAAGAHDDGLIKPSEYLKSIGVSGGGGGGGGADANEVRSQAPLLHRTKSELSVAVQHQQQQHHQKKQPLATISIQDLHSVQLKKTPGAAKMMMNNVVADKSQPAGECAVVVVARRR